MGFRQVCKVEKPELLVSMLTNDFLVAWAAEARALLGSFLLVSFDHQDVKSDTKRETDNR